MAFIKLSLIKLLSFATFGVALTTAAAGCAADTSEADDDAASSEDAMLASKASKAVTPGTFKLYGQPNASPNPMCDVHTSLTLSHQGGARAKLSEALSGVCEIYVFPQTREYRLHLDGTSCGSKIYKGKTKVDGKTRAITITDHRPRICRDLVPAKIIVEETDATGAVQTKYSLDGQPPAPAPTSTWLTVAPKQCGTNPWNGAQAGAGKQASYLQGEAGEVDNFFRANGIELEQIGFAHPGEPMMVCMACSCPRGDTLVVHAKSSADAQKLVAEYGFAPMTDAFTKSPTQCGTNAWEAGQPMQSNADESYALSSWAKSAGAPLSGAGFVDYTEPMMVCEACSCPRGDIAVAFPADATYASKLENLGWTRVEN